MLESDLMELLDQLPDGMYVCEQGMYIVKNGQAKKIMEPSNAID